MGFIYSGNVSFFIIWKLINAIYDIFNAIYHIKQTKKHKLYDHFNRLRKFKIHF